MGTITVNVPDEVEQRFRKAVRQRYGMRKGSLGRALAEAMQEWQEGDEMQQALEIMRRGCDLGGAGRMSREEMHDRNRH